MEASQTQYNEDQLAIDPDYVKHVAAELTGLTQEQLDARYDAAEKGSAEAELIEAELARRENHTLTEDQQNALAHLEAGDIDAAKAIDPEFAEQVIAEGEASYLPEPITRIYVEGKRSAIQVEEPFDEVTNQLESGASLLRLKARTKGAHLEVAIPASRIVSVTGAWSL